MLQHRGKTKADLAGGFLGTAFELAAHFLREFVDNAHPARRFALQVGYLKRHFTGKERRRDRALELISQSLLYFFPYRLNLPPATLQGSAQFARHSIHVVNGEIHVNRNRLSNVLEHHVAFDGLGFEEGLIDEDSYIFPGTKLGQRLRRGGYDVGFFVGDLLNSLSASRDLGKA